MNNLQKLGGLAAWVCAFTYLVGYLLYLTLLSPIQSDATPSEAQEQLAFLVEHQAVIYVWNLVIYVLFGVFLVGLVFSLNERLRTKAPAQMLLATAFGLIWSGLVIASGMVANIGLERVVNLSNIDPEQALTVGLALGAVTDGLGGGTEIVGALWVLLVSWAGLEAGLLPKGLHYLGLAVAFVGMLVLIPALSSLGVLLKIGQISWFVWLGMQMLLAEMRQDWDAPDNPMQ
ncbi:hypothetical protein P2G88_16480 [Aliiglaciecola sp. CAU 1673]|uniref:hypothetical protein n=1 Tax=Aliiglaciecola sp. CAU 1673 TaxID=3032595 RepID=UPI0023DA6648|nr:hypothetical protein [Aliiglaciecola sp. CAU 1673]MDF2179850.1 hypothetical protein [Aliiglaciecola sp. CAU 1673]